MALDLPADGRRLVQRAEGYRATVVSGVVIFEDGVATGGYARQADPRPTDGPGLDGGGAGPSSRPGDDHVLVAGGFAA